MLDIPTCGAVRPLVVVRVLVGLGLVLDQAAAPELIAVQTHEETAHAADPVVVEKGRLADVAHLADTLHRTLPGHILNFNDNIIRMLL